MSNEVEKQLAYEAFEAKVPEICKSAEYSELWGYDLLTLEKGIVQEKLLRKFLVANNYEEAAAQDQLKKCLKWRKEFNPLKAAFSEQHKPEFENLGVITKLPSQKVLTWNLYGAVKNRQELFGDKDGFLRWRVGLMERGIALLDFDSLNENLAYVTQIHDYMDVSFFRLDGETKAATKATIEIFQEYYPEMLDAKYFVNVPRIMSWMFTFMKMFLSAATAAKFHVVVDGKDLAKDLDVNIPQSYGGQTESLVSSRITAVEPRFPALVSPSSEALKNEAVLPAAPISKSIDTTVVDEKTAVVENVTDNQQSERGAVLVSAAAEPKE